MTGALTGIGNALGGVGALAGAAGSLYQTFQDPPKQANNTKPFRGIISTPQYRFGGGVLTRKNDDFLSGQRRIRDLTAGLREQVRPGFGMLTETGINAIRQRSAQAAGNLRTQLARRGLAGASFADDQLTRVGLEYSQAESEFRAQAFQQELAASAELIDRESASLITQATQELAELQVSAGFLQGVEQVALSNAAIEKALKEEQLLQQAGQPPPPAAAAAPPVAAASPPRAVTPQPRLAVGFVPARPRE